MPFPPDYAHRSDASAHYRYIRRLDRIGGQPLGVDAAWIDADLARRIGDDAMANFPTLLLLHEMPGVTIDRVLQRLRIASADVELSHLLALPLNAPLAVIDRTLYGSDDKLLCVYQSFTRGDTFQLKMRLR